MPEMKKNSIQLGYSTTGLLTAVAIFTAVLVYVVYFAFEEPSENALTKAQEDKSEEIKAIAALQQQQQKGEVEQVSPVTSAANSQTQEQSAEDKDAESVASDITQSQPAETAEVQQLAVTETAASVTRIDPLKAHVRKSAIEPAAYKIYPETSYRSAYYPYAEAAAFDNALNYAGFSNNSWNGDWRQQQYAQSQGRGYGRGAGDGEFDFSMNFKSRARMDADSDINADVHQQSQVDAWNAYYADQYARQQSGLYQQNYPYYR